MTLAAGLMEFADLLGSAGVRISGAHRRYLLWFAAYPLEVGLLTTALHGVLAYTVPTVGVQAKAVWVGLQ